MTEFNLNILEIEKNLSKNKILKNIVYFKKIDSTNNYAENLIETGRASKGTIILADEQTKGHGRKSKAWFSPKFVNFYGTFIIKNEMSPSDFFYLTIISSLAVQKTLKSFKLEASIKWPNDILVKKKKISGILTKIIKNYALIGIGININWNPENSLELRDKATSMSKELRETIHRESVISVLLKNWEKEYFRYFKNKKRLLQDWKAKLHITHKEVKILSDGQIFQGKIVDIQNDGGLILDTNEKKTVILYNIDKF